MEWKVGVGGEEAEGGIIGEREEDGAAGAAEEEACGDGVEMAYSGKKLGEWKVMV